MGLDNFDWSIFSYTYLKDLILSDQTRLVVLFKRFVVNILFFLWLTQFVVFAKTVVCWHRTLCGWVERFAVDQKTIVSKTKNFF